VQRRVVTLAKQTPERAWLGEVASVALVQACQDARRAYRNWFDSLSGKRKGRKAGHPAFRRKHQRQSIRLTRNGFALHGERLYVAKVGDLRVQWSRGLPSIPSSVTVIKDPDGRYYASFVVERTATPLPACTREVGIDLSLNSLAVTSDGEVIPNPRFLQAKERRLARAQQALSRRLVSALATGRGEGRSVRADIRQDRPVRAHQPGVLGVRGEGRSQAAAYPGMDVCGVRGGPRPRRERGEEHIGGRAGRHSKRLRSAGKTRARPGSARRGRNPPEPGVSRAGGIPVPQGGEDVKLQFHQTGMQQLRAASAGGCRNPQVG
jgi:putative transposase